jgi:hypothetical protein
MVRLHRVKIRVVFNAWLAAVKQKQTLQRRAALFRWLWPRRLAALSLRRWRSRTRRQFSRREKVQTVVLYRGKKLLSRVMTHWQRCVALRRKFEAVQSRGLRLTANHVLETWKCSVLQHRWEKIWAILGVRRVFATLSTHARIRYTSGCNVPLSRDDSFGRLV